MFVCVSMDKIWFISPRHHHHTRIHVHIHIHTHMYVCMYNIYVCKNMYVCINMYAIQIQQRTDNYDTNKYTNSSPSSTQTYFNTYIFSVHNWTITWDLSKARGFKITTGIRNAWSVVLRQKNKTRGGDKRERHTQTHTKRNK